MASRLLMLVFFRAVISSVASGSSLRARLARATGWMLTGSGLNQVFAMLASIGTARILGKTAFGEFGAVRSTILMLAVLAGGGLGLATMRYVAAHRIQDPQRAGRLIRLTMTLAWSLTGLAALVCVLLAKPLAVQVMRSEKLALPLAVSALAIVFSTVSGVQISVIAGCEAFRAVAILMALEGFAAGSLMVVGARLGGVTGAVLGYVGGTLISTLLRHRMVVSVCSKAGIPLGPITMREARAEFPLLASSVLPTMLLVLGAQPAEWLARMLLVRSPNGMAELGLFAAAYSWAQIVQFIPSQIASPALTILSSLVGAGDWVGFRRLLTESSIAVFGAAIIIALPLSFLSKYVIGFYGPSFRDGATVFTAIVLAYAVGSAWTMLRLAFLSAGRPWLQFGFTLGWGVALPLIFVLQGRRTALSLGFSYGMSFVLVVAAQALAAGLLFRGGGLGRKA